MPRRLLLALAIAASACVQGSPSEPAFTTASSSTTTTTTSVPLDPEAALATFETCMEAEGVPVPPVERDALGVPRLGDAIVDLDGSDPAVRAALTACSGVLAFSGGADLAQDPELRAAVIGRLQAFSECMRSEGVAGFPDPVPGFTGFGDPFPPDQVPGESRGFDQAAARCASVLTDR